MSDCQEQQNEDDAGSVASTRSAYSQKGQLPRAFVSSGHTLKPVQHTSKHIALLILVSGCETAYAHLHHISAKHFHAADLGHEKFYFASFLGINFQENKLRQVEEALSVLNRYT